MVGKLKLILQELPPYVFRDVYFEIFIKLIEEDSSDIIHIDLEKRYLDFILYYKLFFLMFIPL